MQHHSTRLEPSGRVETRQTTMRGRYVSPSVELPPDPAVGDAVGAMCQLLRFGEAAEHRIAPY